MTDGNDAIRGMIRVIKEGNVTSINGKDIEIEAQSVCVHRDGSIALKYAQKARAEEKAGITVCLMALLCEV